MYTPAAFRETRLDVLHALIRAHSFGTLVSMVDGELFATHLPFLLEAERGSNGTLVGHMARANPHWASFLNGGDGVGGGSDALAVFQGPHAYVSPSWYVTEQAVPTWNYTVVHAYGRPHILEDPHVVRGILEATVHTFEDGLPNPWSIDRVSEDYVANMARSIVAFEIPMSRLEGKRKLSQNRPRADVEGAVAGLQAHGEAVDLAVADLMLEVADRRP